MIATLSFDTARLEELAPHGFSLATDVAEWLVRQGVPFRVAHEVAGACVAVRGAGIDLDDLTDDQLATISRPDPPTSATVLTVEGSLAVPQRPRRHRAGAGREQLAELRARPPRTLVTPR